MDGDGNGLTTITILVEAVHPFASVAVTVYRPAPRFENVPEARGPNVTGPAKLYENAPVPPVAEAEIAASLSPLQVIGSPNDAVNAIAAGTGTVSC
jgi:hypothetical protein